MGGNALTVLGLTGRYCAGKDYVASLFAARGVSVIDVDRLGHQALESSKEELISHFGTDIINRDSSVDRKRLGSIVFADPAQLSRLEQLVHPHMARTCIRMIEDERTAGKGSVLINAALLHRMGLDILCDAVCFVHAPCILRLIRAIHRDSATVGSFMRVERAQQDIRVGTLHGTSTVHILENWGGKPFIHRQVHEFCATMGI